jgi:hypothetical protein
MTTREYHYFTRKDDECSEYNTFDKKYHDQLNLMQDEILKIAEKLGELDEDINLENIYGLGRLKATDPELRSLAIMQSKDNDIRNEFNTLMEKLIVLKKDLQEEMHKDKGPADLVVNSLTVIDSADGGYIKTISKDGYNTVMIGNHPSGSGSVITYNKEGSPSVRIGSNGGEGGYMNIRTNSHRRRTLFVICDNATTSRRVISDHYRVISVFADRFYVSSVCAIYHCKRVDNKVRRTLILVHFFLKIFF